MLRATLKSLLSRKLRLLLSGLAVVLGVMFVSGAFVLTDTLGRSFDNLFATVYQSVDVQVRAAPQFASAEDSDNDEIRAGVPAELVDKVRAVPGVATATGIISIDGARVIGANGKVITTTGPSRLGSNWTGETALVRLREGRAPEDGDEVVLNAALAKTAGVRPGDRIGVLTIQPRRTFTVVGIMEYSGGRDSLGGNLEVSFHDSVASELMLGRSGLFYAVDVKAGAGTGRTALRDDLRAVLGGSYDIRTGAELQAAERADAQADLSFFNSILLGFAGVALFVGIFLILNTFSIIVAQRTRELALLRALGGSRRQTIGSVLVEALVIGGVSAVVGLGFGIGVGGLLAWAFSNLGGTSLELAGLGVPPAAPIAAFAVGIVVTLVAALLPALRASRILPMAALREAATPDRPLTRLTVSGSVVTVGGGVLLAFGLLGSPGNRALWVIAAGALVTFIGVSLLTPVLARPVVGTIGRLFSWTVAGRLGRLNSGRNPRRTAITASALMVGIALITGVNTVLESTTASLRDRVNTQIKADLLVAGESSVADEPPTFDPSILDQVRAIGGVGTVAGTYRDVADIDGTEAPIAVVTDLAALAGMYSLRAVEGSLGPLGSDQLALDADTARKRSLHPGSTVRVQLAYGDPRTMTVAAIYAKNDSFDRWFLPVSVVPDLTVKQPTTVDLTVADGTPVKDVQRQIEALLAQSPEVTVTDRNGYIRQQTAQYDLILTMVQVLLALAVLIAVLGIVNTLALSVLERTRELGLVRAVGLTRTQAMWMVTVEAVVISVFGALLGVVVGSGLGAAVVRALRASGITTVALPWERIGIYLALGAVIGIVAAVLPAIRAARTNVLQAIAYE